MNLTQWDPFRELEDVSTRLNRFFGQQGWPKATEIADWTPAMDVQETDGEFLLKADLPEVKKEDVKVEVLDGMLSVRGERKQEKEEKGKRFHRVERSYGRFERRLSLPTDVDAKKIAAQFKDGVLEVHMPKSPAARPQAIDVKVS
ncbi:MAG: Hsp20/alpha crystallin family protein [Vicinamibacterales bacterium]